VFDVGAHTDVERRVGKSTSGGFEVVVDLVRSSVLVETDV
jgi:hypothetical protein